MPGRIQNLARRLGDHIQDLRFRISTTGTAPAERQGHVYYATTRYKCIRDVLQKLNLSGEDTFVDVGCGKGRVVCLAARQRLKQVVGIEYSPCLARSAQRNIRRLRGRKSPAKIICQAAEEADYSGATVLYFFNPFDPPVLDSVLNKIRKDREGREIRLAFVVEAPGHTEVFSGCDWLTCYERFEDEDEHSVSLYRSV